MVAVDPRGRPAAQGSAILPSARRELGIGIRRLRLRAEPFAGRFGRTDPAFAGRRDLCEGQIGWLSPAQSIAELVFVLNKKSARCGRFFVCGLDSSYFASGFAGAPPAGWVGSGVFARSVGGFLRRFW